MADDAGERLVVMLEARIAEFEKRMKQAERTGTRSYNQLTAGSSRATKRMQDDMNRSTAAINRSLAQTSTQIGAFAKGMAAVVVSSAAFRSVSQASQQFTALQNALKVTGLEGEALNKTFSALFQIAQKNGTAIGPLVTLYGRAVQVQKELNLSSADLMKFTDGVSTALKAAGTDSQAAAGGLLQLSQALGSGVVRAQEFNSVNEQIPTVMQAVAAGLKEAGGSVGELRKLVNDGKVSSEAFVRAFLAGMPLVEAQAKSADDTISQANERIGNAFLALIGHLDKTIGASSNVARGLNAIAEVVETLGGYIDAASGKLETLQRWLNSVGNNPVWLSIAKFMGAPAPTLGAGGQPQDLSVILNQAALDKLDRSIEAEQTRLDDIISNTMVKADQRTIAAIEQSIAGMKAERDRLAQLLNTPATNAGPGPVAQTPAKEPVKPVSLADFKLPGDKDKAAQRDTFERALAMTQRQIDLMGVEARTIDMTAEARARARMVVELETAAREANRRAGKSNVEVTDEQRQKIELLADAYGKARGQLEALNGPLATFARESQNVGQQLEHLAVNSLDRIASDFGEIVTGTKTVEEAFRSMAQSIIAELAKIMIKKAMFSLLGGLMGGGGMGGGGGLLGGLFGFDGGGYTGPGPKHMPKGVVHAGEVVWSQRDVARAGGVGVVEGMRLGLRGYDRGGGVEPPSNMRTPAAPSSASPKFVFNITTPPGTEAKQGQFKPDGQGGGSLDLMIRQAVENVVMNDCKSNGTISKAISNRMRMYGGR